jgi:CRP/FNR family transcriptional regulator
MNLSKTLSRDLRTLPCLAGLKEEELSIVGKHARIIKFLKKDTLFTESDAVDFLYVVRTGRIKLFKTSAKGKELIIKTIGPHEYFCCAPVFGDGKHFVSAMVTEESELVVIPVKNFKDMLNMSVSDTGMRIIDGLCQRVQYLSNLLENVSFNDVEQRVIGVLLRLAEEQSSENNIVPLSINHRDIASMTGTVREVVSRTILRLKKEGIIRDSNKKGFKIDREKLSCLISQSGPSVT